MIIKEGVRYTQSHEWVRIEGDKAVIGITDYAQDALGDIVYVELPSLDQEVAKGDEVVNIESVKVAEAVYTPVSGRVTQINEALGDAPEQINKAPYDTFIYAITFSEPSELDQLLDAEAYKAHIDAQE